MTGSMETVKPIATRLPKARVVDAAGVNPVDWKIRAGYLQEMMPAALQHLEKASTKGKIVLALV